jgi:hypothetical protein
MATLTVSFSIDANDNLIITVPSVPTPTVPPSKLEVENGLQPGASQEFDDFGGSVSLGPATSGVFLVSATLNDTDTASAVVSIFGLPGSLTVISGVPVAVTAGAVGFDISGPPPVTALPFFTATDGFSFGLRYVANPTPGSGTMDSAETGQFLNADIALMVVQHPVRGTFAPDPSQAALWGSTAVAGAIKACIPKGTTLFCDLEEVTGAAPSDVTDFFNTWSATVSAAGYGPGIYVGSNCVLDADGLAALNFSIFWRAGGTVPALANGYNIVQTQSPENHGDPDHPVSVDVDTIQAVPGPMMWLKRQA